MQSLENRDILRASVDETLKSLANAGFRSLRFPGTLESRFEAETRKARSYRMWFEGLVAIIGLNACLILDSLLIKDIAWLAVLQHTLVVTPIALLANAIVRMNPEGWVREGSVSAAMIAICWMNVLTEGNATAAATLFGTICVLITALFIGVVMRLRFPYVMACIAAMLPMGLWSLLFARGLRPAESVVGCSLMLIGIGIILVASHSLEREERKSYLLHLERGLQAEELESINEMLQRLSSVDKLTGLPNRRALEERFDLIWADCARTGNALSAVVIDVDHFKMVNDVYGHLYGDQALQRLGGLLPKALRSAEDMAARFGGEEFILLLPHAEEAIGMAVAERARLLVETAGTPLNAATSGEPMLWITVSCGVSSCVPEEGHSWRELVGAADEALYAAKRGGRNRVEFRHCRAPEQDRTDLAGKIFFDKAPKRLCV